MVELGELVVSILLALTALTGTLLNGITIAAFVKFKLQRSPSDGFILYLSISDTLVSTVAVPARIWLVCSEGKTFDMAWKLLPTFLFCNMSILGLCMVSVDRYMKICCPYRYQSHMTRGKMGVLVVSSWLLTVLLAIGPILYKLKTPSGKQKTQNAYMFNYMMSPLYLASASVVTVVLPTLVMTVAYTHMLVIARRHRNQIFDIQRSMRPVPNMERNKVISGRRTQQRRIPQISDINKDMTTISQNLGLFILSVFPILVVDFLQMRQGSVQIPEWVVSMAMVLSYLSPSTNALVYVYRNKTYLRHMGRLLRPCRR